jgi:hypothetical protein
MMPQPTCIENGTEPAFMTLAGNSAGSPEPILRLSPATGRDAEFFEVEDPYVGYDAEKIPYQQPQRQMRSPSRPGPLGG